MLHKHPYPYHRFEKTLPEQIFISIIFLKTLSFLYISDTRRRKPSSRLAATQDVFSPIYESSAPVSSQILREDTGFFYATTTTKPKARIAYTRIQDVPKIDSHYSTSYNQDYNYDDVTTLIKSIPKQSKVLLYSSGIIKCFDQGNFPHPISCRKFISCAKMETGDVIGWEYTCPKNLSFDPIGGICNWETEVECKV